MEITLTTPALLFPAISLLFLSYTNKYLTIAGLIRNLYSNYKQNEDYTIPGQLQNLRKRLSLIKMMQALGVWSFIGCVLSMFLIFRAYQLFAEILFGVSLLCLLASLVLCMIEIQMSSEALNIQLQDMQTAKRKRKKVK